MIKYTDAEVEKFLADDTYRVHPKYTNVAVSRLGETINLGTNRPYSVQPKFGRFNIQMPNGSRKGVTVMGIVWETFVGPLEPGFRVFRKDKNSFALDTLEIGNGWKTEKPRGKPKKVVENDTI